METEDLSLRMADVEARLVLFREQCNSLIKQAEEFVAEVAPPSVLSNVKKRSKNQKRRV